ncbi:MAG TPA: hypothetical protein DHU75_09030 [Rikenellaceae bacterium]|nr:hypothetical protein [Rikenellaceae bacterium]
MYIAICINVYLYCCIGVLSYCYISILQTILVYGYKDVFISLYLYSYFRFFGSTSFFYHRY